MTDHEKRAARMGARHKRQGLAPVTRNTWTPDLQAAYDRAYAEAEGPSKPRRKPTPAEKSAALGKWRRFAFYRYL